MTTTILSIIWAAFPNASFRLLYLPSFPLCTYQCSYLFGQLLNDLKFAQYVFCTALRPVEDSNVATVRGSAITLPCRTSHGSRVTWLRIEGSRICVISSEDHVTYPTDDVNKFSVSPQIDGWRNLTITEIDFIDATFYACLVNMRVSEASYEIHVVVAGWYVVT